VRTHATTIAFPMSRPATLTTRTSISYLPTACRRRPPRGTSAMETDPRAHGTNPTLPGPPRPTDLRAHRHGGRAGRPHHSHTHDRAIKIATNTLLAPADGGWGGLPIPAQGVVSTPDPVLRDGRHARAPQHLSTSTKRVGSSASVHPGPAGVTSSLTGRRAPFVTATSQESKQTCASAGSTVWP
jgi:hypothetical protein